jgi:multiple sugar transport system permease protein
VATVGHAPAAPERAPFSGRRPLSSAAGGRGQRRGLGQRLVPYLLIFPGLAYFSLFAVYPLLKQIDVSFFNWSVMPGAVSPFVGLQNYIQALHDPVLLQSAWNNVLYVVMTVPAQMLVGFAAAHLLVRRLPLQGLWRTLIYLPVITSWVVVSFVFAYLFNAQGGIANALLEDFLGPKVQVFWLQYTWTADVVIWLLAVWKGVGWSMVMFLAALSGLPKEIQEAGYVDGARGLRHWWHVIVPMVWPTVTFVLAMLIIGGVQAFLSILLLTAGGPYNTTGVILTYTFQQAWTDFNFGYSAAISTLMGVVLLGVTVFQLRLFRRRWAENG